VDFLRQIGCDLAQGFLFSRPIPQQALSDTLAAWDEHVEQFREENVESSVPAWRPGNAHGGLLRDMRIVAVDDEPGTLSIAEAVLTDAGATVYATHSVADAIARVASERPDIVVFDLQMPGLSGWEFIKLLHHDAPDLPVVVVSGYIDDRMRAMHQPDGVVSKPYRASTLVNTVRQVVQRHASGATRSSEAPGSAA
jgi:CheY-like chemotaxis protein